MLLQILKNELEGRNGLFDGTSICKLFLVHI